MVSVQKTHVIQKTGKDGVLRVEIPLGTPETEFDVVVLTTQHSEGSSSESAWPPGYFERVFGSIPDLERPPQAERETRLEIE